jgi:hypothetical protein
MASILAIKMVDVMGFAISANEPRDVEGLAKA